MGRLVSLLVGLLVGLSAVGIAWAQEPTPTPVGQVTQDDVNRVAKQLYCPVCENEPLDVCQTAACVQWKAQIRDFLDKGRSEEEIKQIFVERFGMRVLGDPSAALLSILPIIAVVAGGAYAFFLIRRLVQRGAAAPIPPAPQATSSGDEYVDRVERDLKQQL
jgi:cytochrome c-type biogenesis protein CcmH